MALIRNEQVSPAESEVDSSLYRKFLVFVLQMQQLSVIEREKKGSDVAVLNVLLLFVFGEHYAGISSKLFSLMRTHEEHDRTTQIKGVQIFGEELIAGCPEFQF